MSNKDKKKYKRLMEISEELFWKYGYAGVTMDDIAKVVGISKATVYNYFHTKEDLFVAVLMNNTDYHMEKIMSIIGEKNHTIEKIDSLYSYMFEVAKQFPLILTKDVMERGNIMERIMEYKTQKVHGMWKYLLEDGIEKGEIRQLDVEFTSNLLLHMPIAIMKNEDYLSEDEGKRLKVHESLFDFIKYGLLGCKEAK